MYLNKLPAYAYDTPLPSAVRMPEPILMFVGSNDAAQDAFAWVYKL